MMNDRLFAAIYVLQHGLLSDEAKRELADSVERHNALYRLLAKDNRARLNG